MNKKPNRYYLVDKQICSIFLVLLLVVVSLNGFVIGQNSSSENFIWNHISSFSASMQSKDRPSIEIESAKGGDDLEIIITNTGIKDFHDLEITTSITGGLVLSPRVDTHDIPYLGHGDNFNSWKIKEKIIGLGSGIIGSTPTVNVMLKYGGVSLLLGSIQVSLLGLFIRVKQVLAYDENAFEGYTLFTPEYGKNTFLIDNQGIVVHTWVGNYIQGMGTYLMENGNLIRADMKTINPYFAVGGLTGHIGIYEPDGSLVWEFEHSTSEYCLHHDIEVLPNGNILLISWEFKTFDDAIQAGRNPALLRDGKLFPCYILEVKPIGSDDAEIVWEWHLWDHLIQDFDPTKDNYGIVEDHPERVDINYDSPVGSQADWTHTNSIDYHEEFDQIMVSVRNFNEIWIIDHSTTTEEAAGSTGGRYGRGGDLLYRWGNPIAYRAGDVNDQVLFRQHDATWIEEGNPGEGNILIFNNARLDEENPNIQYSTVDEIKPPVTAQGNYIKVGAEYGPFEYEWQYIADNPGDFCSNILASAQRLPNGNTLICNGGKGYFFEVTTDNGIVWEYQNTYATPDDVFKALRYAVDYPGVLVVLSSK